MRLIIKQTSCDEVVGRIRCAICSGRFHLGPATCEAISDDGVNLGQVCPRCLEGGAEFIQERLEQTAEWAEDIAEEERGFADEGVGDCPTVEEFRLAEAFYERPMFRTEEEYGAAICRGEL